MTGEEIGMVTIAVVGATQLAKWSGVPDRRGPLAVIFFAGLGTGLYAWSQGSITRASMFSLFAAWVMAALAAAGVYGFTRSTPDAITSTKSPPSGAGSSTTT